MKNDCQNLQTKLELISSLLKSKPSNEHLQKFKNTLYTDFLEFANKENSLPNEAEMILN